MSKQSQASAIVKFGANIGQSRADIIQEICTETGAGPAYAATLYAAGKKAMSRAVVAPEPWITSRKPKGTTVSGGQMASFTNANLDLCRTEMDAALAEIGSKFGITAKIGNIRYSADRTYFTTSIKANVGDAGDQAQREWDKYAPMYGLKKTDLGRTFISGGIKYTLSGVKPSGKKYNVLAKNTKGKCFKFVASNIVNKLK